VEPLGRPGPAAPPGRAVRSPAWSRRRPAATG
jgi:hypothetical protein